MNKKKSSLVIRERQVSLEIFKLEGLVITDGQSDIRGVVEEIKM